MSKRKETQKTSDSGNGTRRQGRAQSRPSARQLVPAATLLAWSQLVEWCWRRQKGATAEKVSNLAATSTQSIQILA